jgi:hypothetical protein
VRLSRIFPTSIVCKCQRQRLGCCEALQTSNHPVNHKLGISRRPSSPQMTASPPMNRPNPTIAMPNQRKDPSNTTCKHPDPTIQGHATTYLQLPCKFLPIREAWHPYNRNDQGDRLLVHAPTPAPFRIVCCSLLASANIWIFFTSFSRNG